MRFWTGPKKMHMRWVKSLETGCRPSAAKPLHFRQKEEHPERPAVLQTTKSHLAGKKQSNPMRSTEHQLLLLLLRPSRRTLS